MCCNVLQCVVVCCNVLQRVAVCRKSVLHVTGLQCVEAVRLHCTVPIIRSAFASSTISGVLQCVVVCCSVL